MPPSTGDVNNQPSTPSSGAHPFIEQLNAEKKFFIYRLTPSTRPGKLWDKQPLYKDPSKLMYAEDALQQLAVLGAGHCLGYYFTEESKQFFYDIDGCRNPKTGELSPRAMEAIALFQGAYMEVSVSGTGVHIVGSYRGERPAHGCRRDDLGLELYTADRGMAIGTPYENTGSVNADFTAFLGFLIVTDFPSSIRTAVDLGWTTEPVAEWRPPITDKEELLKLFLAAPVNLSAAEAFSRPEDIKKPKVSNADLWYRNETALGARWPDHSKGRAYDPSGADAGLAQRLAYWFGNNCETIEEIMRRPDCLLARDRWDEPRKDYGTYLRMTIQKAVAKQDRVLGDTRPPVGGSVATMSAGSQSALGASLTVPSGTPDEMTPEDFWALLPSHKYINRITRELHTVDAVNGHLKRFGNNLGMKPSLWLDQFRAVQQMNWYPGYPEIIAGKVAIDGTLKDDPKGSIYNLYRASDAVGTEGDASPWLNRVRTIYPDDADYIFQWFAYRIQNPGAKINHALVLGGKQGIGKDWMLQPIRYGVGAANFKKIDPEDLFRPFSEWVTRTLVLINEGRDMGDANRYTFYDKTKKYIASPPETLSCHKKGLDPYDVPNVMAVVITSNNKLNGLYIDPDDRRHYVAWSEAERPSKEFFDPLWTWMLKEGGQQAALGYLERLDISGFRPMAPPPQTAAWQAIVDAGRNPDEIALSDALEDEKGDRVQVATIKELIASAQFRGYMELADTLRDKKNARKIPHMLHAINFEVLKNPYAQKDGRWIIAGRKEFLYANKDVPYAERIALANKKVSGGTAMAVTR